jgi:hypothetical protein
MEEKGRDHRKDTLPEFERRKVVTGGCYGNQIFVTISREISIKDKELISFILCLKLTYML